MQRRQIIMDVRTSGHLKGVKPVMIYLKANIGKIYNDGYSDFVMSYHNGTLFFQKLTFFFHHLKPSGDFELKTNRFKEYQEFEHITHNSLCLYDEDKNFIEIHYDKGTMDTAPGEDNIKRIIKILEEAGCKKVNITGDVEDEGTNSGTKKSN